MSVMNIHLGSIDQVPLGQGRCFVIGPEEIAVFRTRDGRLCAAENRCPHRQGPLSEGIIGADKVVCPLHGHKFSLTTGQGSEAQDCLKVFKVWENNQNIVIQLDLSPSLFKESQPCAKAAH